MKVSVIPGFNTPEDVVEIDGYTKLHTIEILRETFDKKTMNDEMHMIQALNHSIFQLQNKLQKDTKTKPIYAYMQRVFTKPCFINSLSELERDIRDA